MTVPVYAWFSVLLGEPLPRDGGSRLKGVNSLKLSKDLWGPVRWHSRLNPFPYSEPLTNLAFYIGARGMSDKAMRAQRLGVGSDRSNDFQGNRSVLTVFDGPIELPGDIKTRFTRSIRIRLPHRPHSECDGESRLDPIPHSGCTRSVNWRSRHTKKSKGDLRLDLSRLKSGPDSSHSMQGSVITNNSKDRPQNDGEANRDFKRVTGDSATFQG
ncbi:hypothetical protein CRG98_017589 [Punica granatum]|uniref:Uncharacterized protein n=1 Tax=Punica granatum TaxID=22663 RepID=A0A2I0K1P0_PUNGR|nr:hypothetical protein CRG98_017589 [Punica granatum]